MLASFWTTYKRTRFQSRAMSEDERMQQRERFGAACLAQCLRHDSDFRTAFLKKICGLSTPNNFNCEITVDKYHWADILLTQGDLAVIVECKVADALTEKQNPWGGADLFTSEPEGYAVCITKDCQQHTRFYVTLTASRKGSPKRVAGINCLSATWSDIIEKCGNNNSWVNDLFVSLANLDYSSFRIMKVQQDRVTDVKSALLCHEILASLAKRIGVANPKIEYSAQGSGKVSAGYIGVEIKRLRDQSVDTALRKMIGGSQAQYLTWFGYEFDESLRGASDNLSVWFYCTTPTAAKSVRDRAKNAPGWSPVPADGARAIGEKHFLQYRASAGNKDSDVKLFLSLLGVVLPAFAASRHD